MTEPPDPEPPTPPSTGFVPSGAACRLVIDEDFSAYSGAYTTYTQANMMRDFGETLGPYKGLDGRTKVGESSIRAFFPKDTILGQDTGFTWFSVLPGDTEQAIMEYRMKFETGFDWTLGGKLPGFCGGTCPRGCTDDVANGFSMRLMWHRRGEMITYPYWPAQPADQHCGGNWAWSKTVVSGVWYTVRQHLRLNTPGQPNGVIRMYLDGALVQERTDVLFRNAAGIKIDKAYFTTYVGGSTMEFAPDHDQHIWFDSFKVWVGCSA